MVVQYLDEPRHVGALEIMGQMNIHIERGDGVLHPDALVLDLNRMTYALDADPVDCKVACIG